MTDSQPSVGRRAKVRILRLLHRPTVLAQGLSAAGSLLLVALLTRHLGVDEYGIYGALFATFTFIAALVATTIGTRTIEEVRTGGHTNLNIVVRRDLPPVLISCLVASGIAISLGASALIVASTALTAAALLGGEIANAYLLAIGRFWTYCTLTFLRTVVWIGVAAVSVLLLPAELKLPGAVASAAVGSLIPVAYVVSLGSVVVRMGRRQALAGLLGYVGLANLALWLLASADRVILAHFALSTLGVYVALYGMLDRTFRSLANADVQMRLPAAFDERVKGSAPVAGFSAPRLVALVLGSLVVAVCAPAFTSLVSGGRYVPEIWMSVVLTMSMCAMLAAVPGYVALIAYGRARQAAAVAACAAAVNVAGNLILDRIWGTAAAACLTLAGYAIWLVGTQVLVRRGDPATAREESTRHDVAEELYEVEV
jgi:O-antigen/teichoic acid export membrane protein